MQHHATRYGITYHVLGMPFRSGSLHPDDECDAPAYREANLILQPARDRHRAVDDGDLMVPSYLPHHMIPPFRNWPGPRIVWDTSAERLAPFLRSAHSDRRSV